MWWGAWVVVAIISKAEGIIVLYYEYYEDGVT
jgi:hypothetical protein